MVCTTIIVFIILGSASIGVLTPPYLSVDIWFTVWCRVAQVLYAGCLYCHQPDSLCGCAGLFPCVIPKRPSVWSFDCRLFYTTSEQLQLPLYHFLSVLCTEIVHSLSYQFISLSISLPVCIVYWNCAQFILSVYLIFTLVYLVILHMCCIIVTRWGEPGKIEAWFLNIFLQCFDTVDWVIWPVQSVPDTTYDVFGGTLNLTQLQLLYHFLV